MKTFPLRIPNPFSHISLLLGHGVGHRHPFARRKASRPRPTPAPDVLVLSNGDTLHGKFVSETAGKVTFHSDPLGDVVVSWDKVKELHVAEKFGVLSSDREAARPQEHHSDS